MEFLAQALPILVWFLLAILLVVFIIVGLKLIEMINATKYLKAFIYYIFRSCSIKFPQFYRFNH